MPVQSKIIEELPSDYGYVLLVGVGSGLLNIWLSGNVARGRKQYNVQYPDMYSADSKTFNCIQRAHQNTIEMYPAFLFYLLTGGLMFPRVCAGAGALWILGRVQFARGYYTGDPDKRKKGSFGILGMLTMMGSTAAMAVHKLGWYNFA